MEQIDVLEDRVNKLEALVERLRALYCMDAIVEATECVQPVMLPDPKPVFYLGLDDHIDTSTIVDDNTKEAILRISHHRYLSNNKYGTAEWEESPMDIHVSLREENITQLRNAFQQAVYELTTIIDKYH